METLDKVANATGYFFLVAGILAAIFVIGREVFLAWAYRVESAEESPEAKLLREEQDKRYSQLCDTDISYQHMCHELAIQTESPLKQTGGMGYKPAAGLVLLEGFIKKVGRHPVSLIFLVRRSRQDELQTGPGAGVQPAREDAPLPSRGGPQE